MSKYAEPWSVEEERQRRRLIVADAKDDILYIMDMAPDVIAEKIRRSAKCVNAMRGIEDPSGFIAQLRDYLAAISTDIGTNEHLHTCGCRACTAKHLLSQLEG